MGVQIFQIEVLNKSVLSFFPGETIEGIVHVKTVEPNKTEGISMTIIGKGTVGWTEDETYYSAEEEYVNQKMNLYGSGPGTGSLPPVLPPGVHHFPFKFTLPLGLPASFGEHFNVGKVAYQMKAEMQRPWLLNHKATVPFTMNSILDLNKEPGASQMTEINENKTLGCFSCKSGSVGFVLRLPKTGYVPGEFLQFNAEFSNESSNRVTGVTASLIQWIHCHAQGKTNSMPNTVCQSHGPAVEPGFNERWSGNVFQIPQLHPSRLGRSGWGIIDVQYCLKIEMYLSGPTINLRKEIPLIIGNIPLQNHGHDEENTGFQSSESANPYQGMESAFPNQTQAPVSCSFL